VSAASDWHNRLIYKLGPKGKPTQSLKKNVANLSTILAHDTLWSGVLAYDEFAETIIKQKPPPWREWDAPHGGSVSGDWCDADTARLKMWFSAAYGLDASTGDALDAVLVVAHRHSIHPVREWLESLRWDGKRRVPTWLVDVMGCEDTPYVRAVGQAWAISAVARAYKPGCKVDTVLVLEGKPGTFKSSVLRALVGDEWFLEMAITDVSNKDALQILRRKWIAEFPEIDGLSRHEQAAVKSYFSRQVDTYRASYGRGSKDYPRQTVFAATTNKSEWLTDETGGTGRRMWPVRCIRGDVALARMYRENFWAEAKARFECGEAWHIVDPSLVEAERVEQDARFRADPWEETISAWLVGAADIGSRAKVGVTTSDVLGTCLSIEPQKRDNFAAARVGSILRRLGWVPGKQESRNGARVRLYRPVDGLNIGAAPDSEQEEEPSPGLLDLLQWREEEASSEELSAATDVHETILK
jgi:putative DNA primase/helicase